MAFGHDYDHSVLPYYYDPYRRLVCPIGVPLSLVIVLLTVYILWPANPEANPELELSNPELELSLVYLKRIHVHSGPVSNVDISLQVTMEIHNPNAFSMNYRGLDVAIGYRGKRLGTGHVESGLQRLKGRDSSYVDAELDFDGVEMPYDMAFLLDDLETGTVPFDTVAELTGWFELIGFDRSFKAMLSCQILVNTNNQTFVRQICYGS